MPSPTTPGTVSATDYEQYTYDKAGNRQSLKRRDGRTLTFTYDNLNRMLSKLVPDGCPPIQPPGTGCPPASATRDVFTSYDILGRQLTARFDSQAGADGVTNAYDGFGNLASSTENRDTGIITIGPKLKCNRGVTYLMRLNGQIVRRQPH